MPLEHFTRQEVIRAASHPGLWLDRALPDCTKDQKKECYPALIDQVCAMPEPQAYSPAYQRWKATLDQLETMAGVAVVSGRILVGIGNASVIEVGITLNRIYGVPMIPGSALKGIAAHYAAANFGEHWQPARPAANGQPDRAAGQYAKIMFGDTTSAGFVTFYDAWYVPNNPSPPLKRNVLTPHHMDYNASGQKPPADSDDPNPVTFLSASGAFLIAVGGPEAWRQTAYEILRRALDSHGVGAKTSSGYGRMTLEEHVDPRAQAAEELREDVERLHVRMVPNNAGGLAGRILQEDLPAAERRALARLLLQKIKDASWRRASERDWYAPLMALAGEL